MTESSAETPGQVRVAAKKPDTVDRELIVSATKGGMEIALVEDGRLVEYQVAQEDSQFNVGDIYLGIVRKINPGLNAAFIDVGHEKDAFLHYTDLGPKFRSLFLFTQRAIKGTLRSHHPHDLQMEAEIVKTGKITQVLARGQHVMVQVLKEPISSKGPRITAEVALPGRYIVMTPFNGSIGVSRRITSATERKRLQKLLESIVPKNWGVIARTAAEGKGVADLHEDVKHIVAQWENTTRNLLNAKPPHIVFTETRKINTLTRDLLSKSFKKITANDLVIVQEMREFLAHLSPGSEKMVQYFQSKKPIFDALGITKQIKSSFGETVSLKSGAYLVIQHTEALHVIDINSGPKIARRPDQEENALAVNLETAEEVARQLRLRDLGGIIIIDFIDMKSAESKRLLYEAMKEAMKEDRAKHTILPVSKFGLMQITRQRVRPEVNIITHEKCPSCNGTGKVESTILLIDDIENRLEYLLSLKAHKQIHLHTHPFIEAYLKRGLWKSKQFSWWRKWKSWIRIHQNAGYQFTEYHFTNANNEEIRLEE
ncbi:MAG: Rne/Rng family ribonuclease [Bacteroidetes bacterium]|nr:Rne/Rng family ribonuclease [Bacteroidota bacterium]